MANCFVLLNDGSSYVLLNDGSSRVQLNTCIQPTVGGGGGSGVGRSKQVGVSVYDRDPSIPPKKKLTPEWAFVIRAGFMVPQETRFEGLFRFKRKLRGRKVEIKSKFAKKESAADAKARFMGPNSAEFYIKSNFAKKESAVSTLKAKWSYTKIIRTLERFLEISQPKTKTFTFRENHEEWAKLERVTAFTHTSSWVGQVIYDSESQEMAITMNGKKYLFCGVPDRIFDAFEGADSKGAYYARNIKEQFSC